MSASQDGPKSRRPRTRMRASNQNQPASVALSESHLRAIQESAIDYAIIATDPEGRITSWNRGAQHVLGWSAEEVIGQHAAVIFTPEDRAADVPERELDTARTSGRASDDRWHMKKDGSRFFANGVLMPLRGAESGFVKVLRDRTGQQRTEENNARLAAIVSSSPDAIMSFSAEGVIRSWNAGAERLFGYTAAEAIGCSADLLVPPDCPEGPRGVFDMAMAGLPVQMESLRRHKDGAIIDVSVTAARMQGPNGKVIGVSAIFRDIRERKQAEEALRRESELTRTLIEHAPNALFLLDRSGRIQVANPAAEHLLDLTQKEMVGHVLHDLSHHHHQDGRPFPVEDCPLARACWAGHVLESYETVFFRRDGALVDVICSSAPILDADGRVSGSVQIVSDIAARKRAEEARQLLIRELDHRVKNLFSVAVGMVQMTARRAGSAEVMAQALTGRLLALAKAHDLIRPAVTPQAGTQSADLAELVSAVLLPHVAPDGEPLRVEGPAVEVGPEAATSLALILHELATNAAKYGALSAPEGGLEVVWRIVREQFTLTWEETGGPPVEGPPERQGFGSQLVRMSVGTQLGGAITYDWARTGVRITLTAPLDRLHR